MTAVGKKNQTPHKWQAFEDFVNLELLKHNAEFKVKLVRGTHDQFLKNLIEGSLHGAILAPMRYVVLSNHLKAGELDVLAQIRRPNPISIDGNAKKEIYLTNEPRAFYQSIIVKHRNSGYWEPHANAQVKFRFLSTRSTSGYIYPMAFFRKKKLLKGNHIVAEPAIQEVFKDPKFNVLETSDPWKLDQYYAKAKGHKDKHVTPRELFREFMKDSPPFDLLGTNDQQLKRYIPDEVTRAKNLVEVYRSEPIPFDPLVVRKFGPLAKETNRAYLRSAFLATGTISDAKRRALFPPVNQAVTGRGQHRDPDIYDFIPATEQTYDSVREAGVLAVGGMVLKLGLLDLEDMNRTWRDARANILQQLSRIVMGSNGNGPRVFLKLAYYKGSDLPKLVKDLKDGDLDMAELPPHHAANLILRGFGSLGQVTHLHKGVASTEQEFVTISAKGHKALGDIAKDGKFALTNEQSSLGYWFPKETIAKTIGGVKENRFVKGLDHYGVLRALNNGAIDAGKEEFRSVIGFMSKRHWNEIEKLPQSTRLALLPNGIHRVPNPILVVSPRFCPCFKNNELQLPGKPGKNNAPFDWSNLWSDLMGIVHRVPENLTGRFDVLKNLQTVIEGITSDDGQGTITKYSRVAQSTIDRLKDHARVFNPDHTLLVVSIILLILAGSVGVVSYARVTERKIKSETILLPEEIGKLILQSQSAAAQLRQSEGAFKKVFSEHGDPYELACRLEEAIVHVLRTNAEREIAKESVEKAAKNLEYRKSIEFLNEILQTEVLTPAEVLQSSLETIQGSEDSDELSDLGKTLDNAKKFIDIVKEVVALGGKVTGA